MTMTREQMLKHYIDYLDSNYYSKDEKIEKIWKWINQNKINLKQFKQLVKML